MCALIDTAWAVTIYASIAAVTIAAGRARAELRAVRRPQRRAHAQDR